MERLLFEGEVYLKPLTYFRELEGDAVRADRHDGLIAAHQPERVTLTVTTSKGSITFDQSNLRGPVLLGGEVALNIFCMYAITPDRVHVDPRNFGFGDVCVVFTEGSEFLLRLGRAAEAVGLKALMGLVEYVDRRVHDGAMGPFTKFDTFEYQNEYRVALSPGAPDPMTLRLGSLEDIAALCPLAKVNDLIAISGRSLPP